MAKYEKTIAGDFGGVLRLLECDLQESGVVDFVDSVDYDFGGTRVAVRVYERYYVLAASRASLTVTIVGNGDQVFVSAIGSGGGSGMVINMDWGSEENIVRLVEKSLEKYLQ